MSRSLEERFWAKVDTTGDCWEWTACKTGRGYGRIAVQGKARHAHRISYELVKGLIPEGHDIDHTCFNRQCVNPDHLRLATRKQNNENLSGLKSNNTSGYRGVFWNARKRKWHAGVGHNGTFLHLGYFHDKAEAAKVAAAKRNELFTHNDLDRIAS